MKKLLLIAVILLFTGCKSALQDFGIVPDDKEPKFDTSPYAQWYGGQLPIQGVYEADTRLHFPSKVFLVYWSDYEPVDATHPQPWCNQISHGAIDQYTSPQPGLTTRHAVVDLTDTHYHVTFEPAALQVPSCFSIFSSPN